MHKMCVTTHFGVLVRVATTWRMSNSFVGMKPQPLPLLSITYSIIKLQASSTHTHTQSLVRIYLHVWMYVLGICVLVKQTSQEATLKMPPMP